jgi:hypothetical protein
VECPNIAALKTQVSPLSSSSPLLSPPPSSLLSPLSSFIPSPKWAGLGWAGLGWVGSGLGQAEVRPGVGGAASVKLNLNQKPMALGVNTTEAQPCMGLSRTWL